MRRRVYVMPGAWVRGGTESGGFVWQFEGDGWLSPLGAPGGMPLARQADFSAMTHDATGVPPGDGVVVAWSGSFAETDAATDECDARGARFAGDPRTWGPSGWARLERCCEHLGRLGRRVAFRTHARHVLSDAPSCAKFLARWREHGLGVLLDPALMLTDESAAGPSRDDLMNRVFESVHGLVDVGTGSRAGVVGVLVSNVEMWGGRVRTTPAHRGDIAIERLRAWVNGLPESMPVVLVGGDEPAQAAALGLE